MKFLIAPNIFILHNPPFPLLITNEVAGPNVDLHKVPLGGVATGVDVFWKRAKKARKMAIKKLGTECQQPQEAADQTSFPSAHQIQPMTNLTSCLGSCFSHVPNQGSKTLCLIRQCDERPGLEWGLGLVGGPGRFCGISGVGRSRDTLHGRAGSKSGGFRLAIEFQLVCIFSKGGIKCLLGKSLFALQIRLFNFTSLEARQRDQAVGKEAENKKEDPQKEDHHTALYKLHIALEHPPRHGR